MRPHGVWRRIKNR